MYSANNEGKPVAAERFSRTLTDKVYEYMASISKICVLINQMRWLINTTISCHRTIKMEPDDVKPSRYIGFYKAIKEKNPKFKVSNNVKISKYENIFCKRLRFKLV